jgi:hypothetical protein
MHAEIDTGKRPHRSKASLDSLDRERDGPMGRCLSRWPQQRRLG